MSLCWASTTSLQVSEDWGAGRKGGPWLQPCSARLSMAPGHLDTYWSGTAPICLGGCKGKHKELKRSQCGNGSCCWLGYKSFCRGTARAGTPGGLGNGCRAWHSQLGEGSFCATHVWSLSSSPGAPADPAHHPQLYAGACSWSAQRASPALPSATSLSPVNCGRPEADFHSVVHGNDWWVGSVVRYSCRPGFLLLGDPASACQSDGHWTPKPTCLREYCWVSCLREERAGGLQAGLQSLFSQL